MKMRRLCSCKGFVAMIACLSAVANAEDEKSMAGPRILAMAPITLTAGATTTLLTRGLELDQATGVRFIGDDAGFAAEIKEKKKADVPNGFSAKETGDTQMTVDVTAPQGALGPVRFRILTSSGSTPVREIRVAAADSFLAEKEPNGGFREAQTIDEKQVLAGTIKEDKDVDVLAFAGKSGQRLRVKVSVESGASLLDPVLTIFGSDKAILASNDDVTAASRGAGATVTISKDGPCYVSIQDAHDRGSAWHSYELALEVLP